MWQSSKTNPAKSRSTTVIRQDPVHTNAVYGTDLLQSEWNDIEASVAALREKALPGINRELDRRSLPELSGWRESWMPATALLSSADGPLGGMISTHRYHRQVLTGLRF